MKKEMRKKRDCSLASASHTCCFPFHQASACPNLHSPELFCSSPSLQVTVVLILYCISFYGETFFHAHFKASKLRQSSPLFLGRSPSVDPPPDSQQYPKFPLSTVELHEKMLLNFFEALHIHSITKLSF